MTELTFKEIRKKERKYIRNHLILGWIFTFILIAIALGNLFEGARILSNNGLIAMSVGLALFVAIVTNLFTGPLLLAIKEFKMVGIPDMMYKDYSARFLEDEQGVYYGPPQEQSDACKLYGDMLRRRQKITKWDIMKAYIPYYVIVALSLVAIVIAWIKIKTGEPTEHYEGNILYYHTEVIEARRGWGYLLAMGMYAFAICVSLLIRRFRYVRRKSCKGCGALGSRVEYKVLSLSSGDYERSRTVEDEYKVGTVKLTDEFSEALGEEGEEVDVIATVSREVTDKYSYYSAKYACRCAYCGKECQLSYYDSRRKR